MATQVQPPLIETEVTMLFLNTLQEPYYDRLMPTAMGSFANMIRAGNLVDHAIKNGRIDMGEVALDQKRAALERRKKTKPKPYTSKINLTSLEGTPRTKTTRTINRITQLRVIKRLMWFPNIHLPITKHK